MTRRDREDPVEALRARRNRLAEKLVARAPRAKQHHIEQDLSHLRQLNEVLALADGIPREPLTDRRRRPLMVAGLILLLGTLFLMWKRTSEGALQVDVWTTSLAGTLGTDRATELQLGLEASGLTFDPLESVDAFGVRIAGVALALRSPDARGVRLTSLLAPPDSRLELDRGVTGRLRVTVTPARKEDLVRAKIDVGPGTSVTFDEDGRLASGFEDSPISALLTCHGARGAPLTVVLDSDLGPESEDLAGLSGLALHDLDFLNPVHAAVEGLSRMRSGLLEATCHVAHTGPEPVTVPRAGVLIADEWNGFVSELAVSERGLHLQWYGSARHPRAGHPSDPRPLLPVLFQRWVGHTPRAYISLLMIYASLLPIMGILRSILGRSDFKPSLKLEEPL